jgi:hypothetical protein
MRSDVELLRIFSAFGIVWFHSGLQNGKDIAYSGLIVFLIFSSYFAVKSTSKHTIENRALRLLIPCVLWSILFVTFDLLRGGYIYPNNYSLLSKILATPSLHLWYLPFVFFCLITIDRAKAILSPVFLASLAAVFVSILLLLSPLWRQWTYLPPLGQYIHALPAIFVGLLFSLSPQIGRTKYILLSLLFVSLAYVYVLNMSGVGLTYTIGIVAAAILLKKESILPSNQAIFEISKLSFGIYLLHPLVLFIVRHIGLEGVLLPVFSYTISATCIYIALKIIPKSITKYVL